MDMEFDLTGKSQNKYKRRVLVVDDEEINRQMLGGILAGEYEVMYAVDGQDAIEKANTYKENLSAILLDLLMPNVDGYEVIAALRKEEELRKVPIIVLTSEKSAEVKSLELGAADFLSKPYDEPQIILARIRRLIELSEDISIISATENDTLTGLYTKEFFYEYGHQFDHHHPEMATDAIVMNFNHFHLINELYGRGYGDKVLISIADGIKELIEEYGGIACRYDADMFYIYLNHTSDYEGVLGRISNGLSELLKTTEIRLRMGVYSDVYRAASFEERFDRALQACNSLRNSPTASVAVYDMKMHEKEVYSAKLLEDFEAAIEQKQFKVLYQPKYNIKGDKPVLSSAEALISWQHPEFGRVSPGSFVPLFEENGLIQKLDHYVWEEAAIQMRRWRDAYGVTVPVSVNISRVDIYDPNITTFIKRIVRENEIDPHDYLLEITESAYTDNSRQIVEVVNEMRQAGFRVEMDDFGSGYSSLNMLTSLPIDALKLDMEFIHNIAENDKAMRMVELILEIADFLGVPTIAEGVETKEQLDLLKKAGCDVIQGFYFSRPISPEEFSRFIDKKSN